MTNKAPWDSLSRRRSMEPTAGSSPMISEAVLYQSLQAALPKVPDSEQTSACDKGRLGHIIRWTLHKKVLNNPANSLALVRVVIKELEKAERLNSPRNIIPLLHTLTYAIIQTVYIPDDLYKRVYDFCKRLLAFPQPYCTIALSYTRQIKAECSIPGRMYERMVVSEQSLKNEHYPIQERVFVFADPTVISGSVGEVLRGDIEESGPGRFLSPIDHMCSVIHNSIQAALGEGQCHGPNLAQSLKDMGEDIEPYFQEVLSAMELSVDARGVRGEGAAALRSRLKQLYREILTATGTDPLSHGSLSDSPLPNPEMSFHLWSSDEDIWRELAKCVRSSSMSEQFSLSQDSEELLLCDLLTDLTAPEMPRHSVMSNDSGIERDLMSPGTEPLPASPEPSCPPGSSGEHSKNEADQSKLNRRGCMKVRPSVSDNMSFMQSALETHHGAGAGGGGRGGTLQRQAGCCESQTPVANKQQQKRHLVARIVTVGDDRVLGRLAKALHTLRKREARRPFLTTKFNLQFYYIPVREDSTASLPVKETPLPSKENPCSLGSYLSMVDPWYDCNINSLGSMIPKLAEMQQASRKKEQIVSDIISYYVRTGRQPVYFTIYSVKMFFSNSNMKNYPAEEVFLSHLEIEFPEYKLITSSVREKQKKHTESFGPVISINYRKATLSGRDVDMGLSDRMSRVQISAIPASAVEDLNCLTLTFNQPQTKTKNNMSNVQETKIRTCNIKVRSTEGRCFTVTLDKDSRRTFADVHSIEISPCLDPGYSVQKTMRSKFTSGEDEDSESGLSKYMNKGLLLPINTFAGILN